MATGLPLGEAKARRWFRRWVLGFAILGAVASLGTAVTYVQARPLLTGGTRSVTGTVVDERKGFLGIRNIVTVTYEVEGERHQEEIPVKGDGFRGARIAPYFYKPGAPIDLLVEANDANSVRTKDRWVPAVYNWGVVTAFATLGVPFLWLLGRFVLRSLQKREPGPK